MTNNLENEFLCSNAIVFRNGVQSKIKSKSKTKTRLFSPIEKTTYKLTKDRYKGTSYRMRTSKCKDKLETIFCCLVERTTYRLCKR
jgi:hypothetical protein